ncbi:tRNA threonylcarbamoyladenosine biosynthesis protein TsaE [hydrothermal vent metagenome]|uniref:tRNA threonylcarbamoyladenosine biosynthesis protein TsaE n=1 Tax=hydrothermal vent metagenome TaxID=652676 RepID=A0A3B0W1I1_9ZZZZ
MSEQHYTLENELATTLFAQSLARAYQQQQAENKALVIYLQGDLGAGKSFFSRAFIQYFLPEQKVKSPTYTIVESYQASESTMHHFDLYRLSDPEELEYLAIRDLLTEPFVALVEWPQKGEGVLPNADILMTLQHANEVEWLLDSASFDTRVVTLSAYSKGGEKILAALKSFMSEK